MKQLIALGLIAGSVAVPAQDRGNGTVPLGDVAGGDAMTLARRLLPPDLRDRVVEGTVRRQWLPGQAYWVGYREPGKPAGRDLCERMAHAVQLRAPGSAGSEAPPETALRVGPVESWKEAAVTPSAQAATVEGCAEAPGYVSIRHEPDRRLTAYRVLVAAMRAAGRAGSLPFRLDCTAEDPEICRKPGEALASLPIDALLGIEIGCTDRDRAVDDSRPGIRMISCRPFAPGAPYEATVAFGPSGRDGQSWRVSFTHAQRWPEAIRMRRSTVTYH